MGWGATWTGRVSTCMGNKFLWTTNIVLHCLSKSQNQSDFYFIFLKYRRIILQIEELYEKNALRICRSLQCFQSSNYVVNWHFCSVLLLHEVRLGQIMLDCVRLDQVLAIVVINALYITCPSLFSRYDDVNVIIIIMIIIIINISINAIINTISIYAIINTISINAIINKYLRNY